MAGQRKHGKQQSKHAIVKYLMMRMDQDKHAERERGGGGEEREGERERKRERENQNPYIFGWLYGYGPRLGILYGSTQMDFSLSSESGEGRVTLNGGMAALSAALQSTFKPGKHASR